MSSDFTVIICTFLRHFELAQPDRRMVPFWRSEHHRFLGIKDYAPLGNDGRIGQRVVLGTPVVENRLARMALVKGQVLSARIKVDDVCHICLSSVDHLVDMAS